MSSATATIQAGACGFVVSATAATEDGQSVTFAITTECPNITALAEALPVVDAYEELRLRLDGAVYGAARQCPRSLCCGCVVPAGLLKVMQIAAGLSLPGAASLGFERG
jgi:hypothetical protein